MHLERRISHQDLLGQIRAAADLLPSQGPISAFAFLNPLQGLESLPFDEAMRQAKHIYGCEPYLDEARYLAKVRSGRISLEDLRCINARDLGPDASRMIAGLVSVERFRMQLLANSIHCGVDRELDWLLAETHALRRFRDDVPSPIKTAMLEETQNWLTKQCMTDQQGTTLPREIQEVLGGRSKHIIEKWRDAEWEAACLELLWNVINRGITAAYTPADVPEAIRHRDLLRTVSAVDCDQWVHEILVRYCAAYLDQGFAHWTLPDRDQGFFRAFCSYYQHPGILSKSWCRNLRGELKRIVASGMTPLDSIEESLCMLGIAPYEAHDFILSTLLALRGFSGMIWQTEIRPDRVYVSSPPGTLVDYLAVRLILDRLALSYCALETLQYDGPLSELRPYLSSLTSAAPTVTAEQQAYTVFQVAQLSNWSPQRLAALTLDQWSELSTELTRFSSLERRRIYHSAYERQLHNRVLDAIGQRARQPLLRPENPRFQIVCCIDAREESFRRHLEELDDDIETFGIAGFFGIPMYYRGAADAHFASLAPIVVTPKHWVTEEVVYSFEDADRNRARARRIIGSTSRSLHVGTRGSLGGAILSTLFGPLVTVPLLSRVLFPRLAGALNRSARQFVAPPAVTRLHVERAAEVAPADSDEGLGFTIAEMVELAGRALRDIGLVKNFAKLVLFMGHGSSCLNNPHESAYHCGACSGSPGGPNARALAAMLNDPRVRRQLNDQGIAIPESTFFLGALHNTATEEISFYDLELLPSSQIAGLRWARKKLTEVAERNAHERCRRFESAPLTLNAHDALLHVQSRTEDLAQTRPEYGNSTNALCFVGRRSRIRGLFLDRRSFLMSYDPTLDDGKATNLLRILSAVIPVCEGINTLYSFSAMDASGWGSGTKLPHNVTSLLGVMDGAASDLRTGIPWQGVDIHEPLRLLFVIETQPQQLMSILEANPVLSRICRNQWSHLAILDPDSAAIYQFIDGQFVPYDLGKNELAKATSSADWYQGRRDHLPFARIEPS
jgi:uncharacterized protein YbcC (UPF0753/DUF2309 family)